MVTIVNSYKKQNGHLCCRAYSKEFSILHTWPEETLKLLNLSNQRNDDIKVSIHNHFLRSAFQTIWIRKNLAISTFHCFLQHRFLFFFIEKKFIMGYSH